MDYNTSATFSCTPVYDVAVTSPATVNVELTTASTYNGNFISPISVDVLFSISSIYDAESLGVPEKKPIRIKRGTVSSIDSVKATTEFEKRKSVVQALRKITGNSGPCAGITSSGFVKRVTATVTDIRRIDRPFFSEGAYKSTATFNASLDSFKFLPKKVSVEFVGSSVYDGVATISNKPTTTFSTSVQYSGSTSTSSKRVRRFILGTGQYSVISIQPKPTSRILTATSQYSGETTFLPKQISGTFSGSVTYGIESTEFTTVSNTFSTSVSYDTFLESASKKVSETFSGSAQYAGESITTLVELSDTFTATPSYGIETISIFKEVSETFSGFVNYSITSDQPQTVSNTFTTTPQYGGETTSEFAEAANTVSGLAQYAGETISIFKQVANTFSGSATYDLEKTTDTTQVSSTFSGTGTYGTKDITQLDYTATATFTSSTQQSVIATEFLQPVSTENNNGWQSANQGIIIFDIAGTTPDSDTGISHSSATSTAREITIVYDEEGLTFVGDNNNHQLNLQFYSTSGVGSINLDVDIISQGSTVASRTYSNISQSITNRTFDYDLQTVSSIDYSDIKVRFTAYTNDASNRQVVVTWGVFELPNVDV